MNKYDIWCLNCENKRICKKPIVCPIGNFDEFDN
jgi:hypothetical protein